MGIIVKVVGVGVYVGPGRKDLVQIDRQGVRLVAVVGVTMDRAVGTYPVVVIVVGFEATVAVTADVRSNRGDLGVSPQFAQFTLDLEPLLVGGVIRPVQTDAAGGKSGCRQVAGLVQGAVVILDDIEVEVVGSAGGPAGNQNLAVRGEADTHRPAVVVRRSGKGLLPELVAVVPFVPDGLKTVDRP